MRKILVLGAGRSSASLIQYLLHHARDNEWTVIVGDLYENAAIQAIGNSEAGRGIAFDINDRSAAETISSADVVVSLLPPHLHPQVAGICLDQGKHLLTASYVSDEMAAYHSPAVAAGLLFLNECGLDPGIDHMSAMQVIDRIRREGGKIVGFESFTGGLIDPASDPGNPWKYKFTWNPRNVVMAGQGTARFLEAGKLKYIPYQQLFRRTRNFVFPDGRRYEGYANRDSLKYIDTYGLDGIRTMLRGTLRHEGFCEAWNVLVQLGCCDDTYQMEGVASMTHRNFISAFLSEDSGSQGPAGGIRNDLGNVTEHALDRLRWSGFFEDEPVGLAQGSPARILEHILNKRWKLNPGDRDLIVMQHQFEYELDGATRRIHASMVTTGDNATHTAMAKTVGLPLAIAARLLLSEKITARGVAIPTTAEFYDPILSELRKEGISLSEEIV